MVRCLLVSAWCWLWLPSTALLAWPTPPDEALPRISLPGEEPRTARRLADADKQAAQQHWAEAIEDYQRILAEAGDVLVPLDPRHSLQARQLCHLRLAALPPAALQLYRARVDPQAKKWLDQGMAQRDRAVLRRLVEEAFCSRYTDQALDLLGDLAFERGDWEEAERCWRLLALPASELGDPAKPLPPSGKLLYPDPKVDLARVRAKQILVRLFRGEQTGWTEELQAFRAWHAVAKGDLAGRQGSYADILAALASQAELLAPALVSEAWPTFAGAPSRQRLLPRAPGRLGQLRPLEEPDWCVRLESATTLFGPEAKDVDLAAPPPVLPKPEPPLREARLLSSYPVIVGNQVLVADARSVTAYKLSTGRPLLRHELWPAGRKRGLDLAGKPSALPDVSYPLTVAEDHVYARLGIQTLGPPARREGNPDPVSRSVLVCLPLHPDAEGVSERWNERWLVWPKVENGVGADFEGAPVVHDGRVYIAVSRFSGVQTQTAIACYDAQTGSLQWQRPICVSQELREGEWRTRHHVLTLAGPLLVYCSHAGTMVALDVGTGRPAWAVRYPSREARPADGGTSPRSLAPCLYAGGRLYAAPVDGDRILCLQAESGRLLWESTPVEVLHLLGVAKGRLIFTFTTPPSPGLVPRSGIRALDAARGTDQGGWLEPSDGSDFPTFGRGFLAGHLVYWPTIRGLRILGQEDGRAPVPLGDNALRGNLVVGSGCLVVAGVKEMWGYVPPASLLEQRRRAAAVPEAPTLVHYRLALSEADAGLKTQAVATLARVERGASPEELWHGVALRDLAQARRYELLCDLAGQAATWDEAAALLTQAAGAEFPASARIQALARQAAMWARARQHDRELHSWQAILSDPALRNVPIPNAAGLPLSAAEWVTETLFMDDLSRARGFFDNSRTGVLFTTGPRSHSLSAPIEQQARALANSAKGDDQENVLRRLVSEYPTAWITKQALLQLATRYEQKGHDGAAAQAYRWVLERGDRKDRAAALVGLARAYERQACWQAARDTWQHLERLEGDETLAALDPRQAVRDWVTRHLQKPEYRVVAEALSIDAAVPVTRTWSTPRSGTTRSDPEPLLVPEGRRGFFLPSDYLVFAHGSRIACREAGTGKRRWERTCPAPPRWIGQHADAVIVAEAHRIHSWRLADGETLWERDLRPESLQPDPRSISLEETALSAFRLAGSSLFFLQGQRRLFALDANRGQVLWTSWAPAASLQPPAPGGRFYPRYLAGDNGLPVQTSGERIQIVDGRAFENALLIQTSGGRRWILDRQTGHKVYDAPTSSEPWPRTPRALDERRVCLVPDARQVMLLDLVTGKEMWTYALDTQQTPSLSGEAPQVLGNKNTLLVLVALNHGYELESLDLPTGKPFWPNRRLVSRSPVDFETSALDDSAVYFVSAGVLVARSLADGRLLWQLPLTASGDSWQTVRCRHYLAVFPRSAQPGQSFAVLFCDPKDGQVVQRLNFPTDGSQTAVQWFARGMAVLVGTQAWGLVAR